MSKRVNELDLKNWKEDCADVLTDSLWNIAERDKSGDHDGSYHGNFIPQIPYQLMRRFTRKGDIVLDPFIGSGTTLIEAQKMGRHVIGLDLNEDMVRDLRYKVKDGISRISAYDATSWVAVGWVKLLLRGWNNDVHDSELSLIIMHPPYHDIIKFSDNPDDLSNCESVEDFKAKIGDVVENITPLLKVGGHIAIVIGDKYTNSQWVPLGFKVMSEVQLRNSQKCELHLKSIVVKNMANSRGKKNQNNLWRWRALSGGFYVFKHEYILISRRVK